MQVRILNNVDILSIGPCFIRIRSFQLLYHLKMLISHAVQYIHVSTRSKDSHLTEVIFTPCFLQTSQIEFISRSQSGGSPLESNNFLPSQACIIVRSVTKPCPFMNVGCLFANDI